ncbi:FAD-dependent oxidoreductase [Candidatus Woesearchaeota archaeon]|nr:FAD-dependent oxidoreductase [Candidatus Woesearchaeota archaeon]MBT7403011.1 FAD-dependent oxidoreductase [Candidatus Woesearchaeota archaeon]
MLYDLIIIGGGVAGLGAAVYAARYEMNVLVVAGNFGGLLLQTHLVENYIGFKSISAIELTNNIIEHAKSYKKVTMKEAMVNDIKKLKNSVKIKTTKGEFEGKTILFATGSFHRQLGIPGEKEYSGKGVSYCGTCDAPMFHNKTVAIIGGSDSAAKESILLAQFAKKVYIIYRGEKLRAEPVNFKNVLANKKIEIIYKTNVKEVKGKQFVTNIILDNEYKGSTELKLDGMFIEIGYIPKTELAEKIGVKTNKKHEIIVDKHSQTNVDGVYSAGDCTDYDFKQAITGVAQGAHAAQAAYEYIKNLKVDY